jgi:hypothetical protein
MAVGNCSVDLMLPEVSGLSLQEIRKYQIADHMLTARRDNYRQGNRWILWQTIMLPRPFERRNFGENQTDSKNRAKLEE